MEKSCIFVFFVSLRTVEHIYISILNLDEIVVIKFLIFTSIIRQYVIEVLLSVKICDIEFSPDLYVLGSFESKKVVFENYSVSVCVCVWDVCVCVGGEYSALYISKTNKDRNPNFIQIPDR